MGRRSDGWRRVMWAAGVVVLAAAGVARGAAANGLPRVMLLVDEKTLGTIPTAEVEAMAIKMLKAKGVPITNQDMTRANLAKAQQMLKMAGDKRGAAALGMEFGADVLISGEAVAKPSARRIAESNLRSYQAVVTLRAVRTDNSDTLASSSEDASVIGLDDVVGSAKALKTAAGKSLGVLIPEMIDAWRASGAQVGAAQRRAIAITVGGVDAIWKLKAVRDRLRGAPDEIASVSQRSYSAGVAVFDIESVPPAEELAEALVLKPPDGLKLQVLEVTAGKMNLRAVAAQ